MAINTRPLSGFRDFGTDQQAQRLWLISLALGVYSRFGYYPIETPALEREEILAGQYGEEGDRLRYRIDDEGKRTIGLRYDLTVPFSRFVADRIDLPIEKGGIRLPYRRSQVAPVWRKERPQAGRYREFYQADFDIAGSSDPASDAEILVVAATLLQELKLDYRLRVNHRGVLDAVLRQAGIPDEKCAGAMVILDKADKVGREATVEMLSDNIELTKTQIKQLMELLDLNPEEPTFQKQLDADGQAAVNNLIRIVTLARAALPDPTRVQVDLWTVRGLSYYTGIVLETQVIGKESLGSVLSGGRYDNTVGTFLGRKVPAVGASLGVDRCLTVLDELGLLPSGLTQATLAVVAFAECQEYAFGLTARLRAAGISVVTFPGSDALRNMLGFAERSARTVVIIGTQEQESGKLQMKDFKTGERRDLTEKQIIEQYAPR